MEYIKRKSLLYKTGVEYGDFTINHVLGCSHGCRFPCYAMMLNKRFGRVKSYEDWCQPKIVENALEILDKEIPKYKNKIEFVNLCFTTDPFMCGYPEIQKLSLEIINKLISNGIKVMVLTKGIYPKDLCDSEKYGADSIFGITLVSLNELFRQKYEPGASNYKDRINALKRLHDSGLKTWVSIEPYPTPNIIKQDLRDILEAVSFVDKIVFGRWNYNSKTRCYSGEKQFYNQQADIVKNFCKALGKDYHIKEGTITEDIVVK